MSEPELKEAIKEAAKEWLDNQMAMVGRWTIKSLAGIILVGLLIIALKYGKL
jgi:hypothetical protein